MGWTITLMAQPDLSSLPSADRELRLQKGLNNIASVMAMPCQCSGSRGCLGTDALGSIDTAQSPFAFRMAVVSDFVGWLLRRLD